MFISARHVNAGMDVSGDKKKDQFASPGLLLQMSSHSVVYNFHLLHIIQKYLQQNPKFRGQAMKSRASSDPARGRAGNRQPVLCCCRHQQRHSERWRSPPRSPLSSGTSIREISTHSQPTGSSCKPATWTGCAKPSSGQQDWNDFLKSDADSLLRWSCYDCSTPPPRVLWANGNYPVSKQRSLSLLPGILSPWMML